VRTPHHTILIDSCVGNHKPRPSRPMWHMMNSQRYESSFKEAGLTFADIDYVMCTHLHTDHVGWNTRLDNGRWVPTFPNARYVFAERELTFWTGRAKTEPESCPWVVDSVLPIVDAKLCFAFMCEIGKRRKQLETKLEHLVFKDVQAKLAALLLELGEEYGQETDEGLQIGLKITHQEMANLIGSTRETISLTLAQFKKKKLLDMNGRTVVLLVLEGIKAAT
jgi:hypothetical protein